MKENYIINNYKPKSIIINGELHHKFKLFCKGKNLKIGSLIEDLIGLYLTDYKTIQKLFEDKKEID